MAWASTSLRAHWRTVSRSIACSSLGDSNRSGSTAMAAFYRAPRRPESRGAAWPQVSGGRAVGRNLRGGTLEAHQKNITRDLTAR